MEIKGKLVKIKERIKAKFNLDDEEITDCIEFAVEEYKRLKNDYETSLDDYTDDALIWIKKACLEIAEMYENDISNKVKSYSENGYSFTLESGMLSDQLIKEIIANADYPK